MNFEKPVKIEINGTPCYKSTLSTEVMVPSQVDLFEIEESVIGYVASKSKEWFGRELSLVRVKDMYAPASFEEGLCITGLVFFSNKFKLDTEIRLAFFDDAGTGAEAPVEAPVDAAEVPAEVPVADTTEVPADCIEEAVHEQHEEPLQQEELTGEHVECTQECSAECAQEECSQECSQEPVEHQVSHKPYEHEHDANADGQPKESRKYKGGISKKHIKEAMEKAFEAGEIDKAYKLGKILEQYMKLN
jgi:hypothetical protein